MKKRAVKSLTPAPYNPRTVTDERLARLKRAMERYGDLSGIVVNRKTGRLVGGNQRRTWVKDAPVIEQTWDKPNAQGTVAVGYIDLKGERWSYREVDVDELREAEMNIAANISTGEWEFGKLGPLVAELEGIGGDLQAAGFSEEEVRQIALGQWAIDPDQQKYPEYTPDDERTVLKVKGVTPADATELEPLIRDALVEVDPDIEVKAWAKDQQTNRLVLGDEPVTPIAIPAWENPRVLDSDSRDRMAASVSRFGDLSGVVFNVRSGLLIGGHQRVKHLSKTATVEITHRYPEPNEQGTVAVGYILLGEERWTYREVDVDTVREGEMNLAANRHSAEWDVDRLGPLVAALDENGTEWEIVGFTPLQVDALMEKWIREGPGNDDDVKEYTIVGTNIRIPVRENAKAAVHAIVSPLGYEVWML